MLHTRFKAESPVLRVGSCHGTQPKVTGLSALPRKANLDKPATCRAPTANLRTCSFMNSRDPDLRSVPFACEKGGLGSVPGRPAVSLARQDYLHQNQI